MGNCTGPVRGLYDITYTGMVKYALTGPVQAALMGPVRACLYTVRGPYKCPKGTLKFAYRICTGPVWATVRDLYGACMTLPGMVYRNGKGCPYGPCTGSTNGACKGLPVHCTGSVQVT